jgi:threonine/homoserine/homoserine lactone efflux protein
MLFFPHNLFKTPSSCGRQSLSRHYDSALRHYRNSRTFHAMSLLFVFTNAFVVGLSGAVMPGPLLTVNISSALRRGFWAGPIVVLGHALAEIGVLIAIYLGLTSLVKDPRIFRWIAVIGGAALIVMGAMMLADLIRKKVRLEFISQDQQSSRTTIILAILASVSSPYWILWWLTVGALLISQSLQFGIIGLLVFYIGHILSDLVWYSIVSFLIGSGKRYFNNLIYQSLIAICALFLVALGIYFIRSAQTGAFLQHLQKII